jgi:hypothetical protein
MVVVVAADTVEDCFKYSYNLSRASAFLLGCTPSSRSYMMASGLIEPSAATTADNNNNLLIENYHLFA